MKVYVLTEEQRASLFNDLKLERFQTPDQFQLTEEAKEVQRKAVESMHHRFHVIVARYLS
jgi:hypothetical protein